MPNNRIDVLTAIYSDLDRRFFINCPVKTIMEGTKCIKMEIPQELAKYMFELQSENDDLQFKVRELEKDINKLRSKKKWF